MMRDVFELHQKVTKGYISASSQMVRTVFESLKRQNSNSRIVYECFEELNHLTLNNTVKLIWATGHSGVKANEAADLLA